MSSSRRPSVMSSLLAHASVRSDSPVGELRGLWADAWRAVRSEPIVALLGLTVAAAILRITLLDMPIRLDEATTFNEFVLQPWRTTLGKYQATNNHPLHSALAKLAVDLLGRDPWVVRLPALIAGVLLVPATYFAARVSSGPATPRGGAWFAAVGVAVLPNLVYFSANARGYSMVALIALVQWLALRDALVTGRRASWYLVAALGALGVYTHLTMVFAYAGNLVWAVHWMRRSQAISRDKVLPVLWSGALSVVAAIVLYLPFVAVTGIDALVANRNVTARSSAALLAGLPVLAQRIGESWATALPAPLAVGTGLCALAALLVMAKREEPAGAFPLVATLTFVASIFVTFRLPPPRSTLYLLPLVLIALGGAVQLVASRLGRRGKTTLWGIAMAPFAVLTAAHLGSQPVRAMRETGWMPEAGAVYERLQQVMAPGDAIASFWLPRDILRYYWLRDGRGAAPLVPGVCPAAPATLFFLVRDSETVELVLRYQRLPGAIAASATRMERFGRYTLWRAPAPAGLVCPQRLQGPVEQE